MPEVVVGGHHYPSEYAWHFGERTDHPATQHDVVDDLRRRHAGDWPNIWYLGPALEAREG